MIRNTRFVARTLRFLLDVAVLVTAFQIAFLIRFEGAVPPHLQKRLVFWLPLAIVVQLFCIALRRVQRIAWRHVGVREARSIATSLGMATVVLTIASWMANAEHLTWVFLERGIPHGVLLLNLVLSFVGLVGLRSAFRLWIEWSECHKQALPEEQKTPTLLIGAGSAGALVARELVRQPPSKLRIVGFLDDDTRKHGMFIHGCSVLGGIGELPTLSERLGVKQVLITMADSPGPLLRQIAAQCEGLGLSVKMIPDLCDVVEGRFLLSKIRDVAVEDLLRRTPLQLDRDAIRKVVSGRKVLVTGAGGSIGSELCRIVCQFGPTSLLLVEHAENSLFQINRELECRFPEIVLEPFLADIRDEIRMEPIFAEHRPQVVFHAAAHKHVSVMERNPGEAIKNNVMGTKLMADLADDYGVETFVMISTDKAVNPTSVMGVSKRVAEIYIQALSQRSATRFVAVRFGNVLGSAGSVLPIFKEQISNGGPVCVTHPEMRRYFMTIPEACQLVLQAASMGDGGEIFILDMGEPVKIVDLAEDLIRLSGLTPNQDIEIRFTGIRPGEKLFEELACKEETAGKTRHPRIFIGRLQIQDWEEVNRDIQELHHMADSMDGRRIRGKFREIVPEYERRRTGKPRIAPIASK